MFFKKNFICLTLVFVSLNLSLQGSTWAADLDTNAGVESSQGEATDKMSNFDEMAHWEKILWNQAVLGDFTIQGLQGLDEAVFDGGATKSLKYVYQENVASLKIQELYLSLVLQALDVSIAQKEFLSDELGENSVGTQTVMHLESIAVLGGLLYGGDKLNNKLNALMSNKEVGRLLKLKTDYRKTSIARSDAVKRGQLVAEIEQIEAKLGRPQRVAKFAMRSLSKIPLMVIIAFGAQVSIYNSVVVIDADGAFSAKSIRENITRRLSQIDDVLTALENPAQVIE